MKFLIFLPFILQAAAIAFDEAYFHVRRGLPQWERIGHPIDTATVLLCLIFILFVPYSPTALKIYVGLSLFSCLMVTKDEWIHKDHCSATENWLHALLFINHPILLGIIGLFWSPFLESWLPSVEWRYSFLLAQAVAVFFFMSYQIFYWNILCSRNKVR